MRSLIHRIPLHIYFLIAFTFGSFEVCQAESEHLNLGRLEQVSLTVSNIARADKFYGEQLGLRKIFSQDNLLVFDLGGTRLLIGTSEKNQGALPHSSSTLYLRCADLKLCIRELESNDIEFNPEPEFVARQAANDLWIVFFEDPDGNSLALLSESPRSYNPVTGKFN